VVHSAVCSIGTGVTSHVKVVGGGGNVDHVLQPSPDVKNDWSYIATPPLYLHDVDRDTFTFTVRRKLSYL
jgi:hypothetical protein